MATEPLTASVLIDADPEHVFTYFTDPAAMVRWMGEFARLDPVAGGEFTVDIRGVPVRGRYLELDPPRRLLVSWGHAGSDHLPPGASTLEVLLEPEDGATRVVVVHRDLPEPEASGHRIGWRHFLARLQTAAVGGDAGPDDRRIARTP
jgi:uncharacterized protein YndB with AHSA1/START domain